MKLRHKTLVIIGLALVGLIVILYTSSRLILLDGFKNLEQQAIARNIQRVVNTIDDQFVSIGVVSADWAYWDDTYLFVRGENDSYVENNLAFETYDNLMLNLIIYLDTTAKMVYGQAVDLEAQEAVGLPGGLEAYLQSDSPLLQHTEDRTSLVSGIIMLDDGPMLVASRPILTSQLEGPTQGTMVMGRFLDATFVQALSDQLAVSLTMYWIAAPDLPVDFQTAVDELAEVSTYIQAPDENTIVAYFTTPNLAGNPTLIWRVDMPRDILAQGETSLLSFLFSLVIFGMFFMILMLILLDRLVLTRISSLNEEVNVIRLDRDFSKRITMPGKDELANFAVAMNDMLAALEKEQDDLKEALKFKSRVLANVSHDARTPIAVIKLRAEMLESGMFGEVNEHQNDQIQSILLSSQQLVYFVNNLLDASLLEAGKLVLRNRDFSPDELMRDVESSLTHLAEKKELTLYVAGVQLLPEQMHGDMERLQQIIYNLVGNAIKFTDEGEVRVEISRPQDYQWAIQVNDTGLGIPEDAQRQLFEAFYQVDGSITRQQTQGVGLGLSIVKELVDLMDGQVTVSSEQGVGSTFTVTLPLKEAKQGANSNGRILIVDR